MTYVCMFFITYNSGDNIETEADFMYPGLFACYTYDKPSNMPTDF